MTQKVVKLEITNNINENIIIEWVLFATNEEKDKWIQEKRQEEHKWNYETSGVQSIRYYYFEEYSASTLLDFDISELKGMTLKDFIKIIKIEYGI